MDSEIVSSVLVGIFTLAGALLGAFLQYYFSERKIHERNRKALYGEIRRNLAISQENHQLGATKEVYDRVRGYKTYHTSSYRVACINGDVVDLPQEVRLRLEDTYDSMLFFNRKIRENKGSEIGFGLIQEINNNLLWLRDNFTHK
jgi:hypothetical protein